ncbi:hypothetical protein NP493_1969g00006 [Ridgeia piscesae]|uniref:Uncharacterized protein n=1 Tax=Ridgeia piscesae TaxID=27915 RepID=A0AAD9JPD2_RIDPI|nr:hypothetical protein NP493_1969g00006 [Ridgeia piscesae]
MFLCCTTHHNNVTSTSPDFPWLPVALGTGLSAVVVILVAILVVSVVCRRKNRQVYLSLYGLRRKRQRKRDTPDDNTARRDVQRDRRQHVSSRRTMGHRRDADSSIDLSRSTRAGSTASLSQRDQETSLSSGDVYETIAPEQAQAPAVYARLDQPGQSVYQVLDHGPRAPSRSVYDRLDRPSEYAQLDRPSLEQSRSVYATIPTDQGGSRAPSKHRRVYRPMQAKSRRH